MARQINPHLTGSIGNFVYYLFRGKPCVRSKPKRIKQTKATKESAIRFGKAVRISRTLRVGLDGILTDPKDHQMIVRLNTAILHWIRTEKSKTYQTELPFIQKFQFNEEALLSEKLNIEMAISWNTPGKIIIEIPKMDPLKTIYAPAGTQMIRLEIIATGATVEDGTSIGSYNTQVDIMYKAGVLSEQEIAIPFKLRTGSITVVGLRMKYIKAKQTWTKGVADKRWLPAAIIGGCYGKPE